MKNTEENMNWKEILFSIPMTIIMILEAITIPFIGLAIGGTVGVLITLPLTIAILGMTTALSIQIDELYLKDKPKKDGGAC